MCVSYQHNIEPHKYHCSNQPFPTAAESSMYQESHRASSCLTVVPSPHCPNCQFTFLPPSFPRPTKASTGNPVPVLSPHTKDKPSLFLCSDPFLHLQYPLLFLAKHAMATWEPTSELQNASVCRHRKTGQRHRQIRAVTLEGKAGN